MQRGLWLAYALRPESQGYYNLSLSVRTRPAIDPERLSRALQLLAAKHPMLRARFREIEGEPMQAIHPTPVVALQVAPVSDVLDESVAIRERADRTRAIPLASEPPMKATLYRAGERESVMCLVFDHLACDGWSLFQLAEELGELLECDCVGLNAQGEGAGFLDYVAHERAWLASPRAHKQLEYWRTSYAQAQPSVELRAEGRARDGAVAGTSIPRLLPARLSRELEALSTAHGVTLFTTLLTAYALLLHRVSSEDDISIASVVPTRGERWKRTVGNFVNPVVMPIRVDPDMTLHALLRAVQERSFRTLKNKDYPFDELLAQLASDGVQRRNAYLKTSFNFHKARHAPHLAPILARCNGLGAVRWGGLEIEGYGEHVTNGFAEQDLKLDAIEFGEQLFVTWTYDPQRLTQATAEAFADRWEALLRAMTSDSGAPLAQLPWLSREERARLIAEWNHTATSVDPRLFHEQVEAHAARAPDALALQYRDRTLSYGELNARANRLAAHLRKRGVGPEVRVALCMERSFELVIGLLAVLKAGGAFVPLDPVYPPERLAHMLRDSAPRVVLTSGGTHARLADLVPRASIIQLDVDHAAWANEPSDDLGAEGLSPNQLAYVIYTSGSTGKPKGAMNEQRGLRNLVAALSASWRIDGSSRVLQFASPSFDASVSEIGTALSSGASLHLADRTDLMPGRPLLETLARHRITHVTLPPTALPLCEDPELPFTPHTLIVAGEAIRASEANKWAARVNLFNAYGPSETSVCATVHRCEPDAHSVPIGRPIANARVYILDRAQQPVPIGIVGEIYVAGEPVGRGYLNLPALTAERFLRDPWGESERARMYRTGDLGRWTAAGEVEYIGRNDQQVKLRGFRIELEEIAARLATLAGVSDAVVIAREDEPGDERLVAYYCGVDAPPPARLRAYAAAALPDYMVPAAYVRLPALPITLNGKIHRAALPPPDAQAYATQPYEAPSGRLERSLAQLWTEVLQRPSIGRHDDFFALGGHSLKAVELTARVRRELAISVSLGALFAHPTLSAFAAAVASARDARDANANLVALRPQGTRQPLFGVHPIGGTVEYLRRLAPHLDPELPLYGLEASGWSSNGVAQSAIPALASQYLTAIRSVQPSGPYRLLGYSAGGLIAYAMAEQLIAAGERVAFLGLLDSHPNLSSLPEFTELVRRIEQTEREQGEDAANRMFLQHALPYLIAPNDAARGLSEQRDDTRSALRGMRATMKGLSQYRPSRLPLVATLFYATQDVSFDLVSEWSAIMTNRIVSVPVRGSHLSMIEPPHIDALANALDAALRIAHAAPGAYTHGSPLGSNGSAHP